MPQTLFWPSGRKLFRQRPRARWVMVMGCLVALAVAIAMMFGRQ